jgi:regulator of sigma D
MLDNCTNKEERFAGVQALINRWLEERQDLVVSYCAMSSIEELASDCDKTLRYLKRFCQVLIDYISAGHFEVYDQLIKEADAFGDTDLSVIDDIYPKISATTDIALAFHETYDNDEHSLEAFSDLKEQLSKVGEAIVSRFTLEDQLIAVLHNAHAEQLAIA